MTALSYSEASLNKMVPSPSEVKTISHSVPSVVNAAEIVCINCGTTIFKKGVAFPCGVPSENEICLPEIPGTISTSIASYYWCVIQMMNFENIGFTKSAAVNTETPSPAIRYLICATCDMGPLGYEVPGGSKFCIAADRVAYT